MESLHQAFVDELRDVYSAEKQLTRALRKMIKAAHSEELREGFELHLEETEGQLERIEKVFESIDLKPRSKHCAAMAGIIEEGSELMEEDADPDVKDALLIAAAQKVEHYEIATYGTLCKWADQLGLTTAKKLLGETLDQEKKTDETLSELAESLNKQAI